MADDSLPIPIDEEARIDRHLIGTAFVGILVGLAYQEAVGPIRESLDSRGITAGTMALSIMFFFTALYLFVSSYISLAAYRGLPWFCAFLAEVLQSVVLIFMASLCSEEANVGTRFTFLDYLVLYYGIDLIGRILVPLAATPPLVSTFLKEDDISGAILSILGPFLGLVWFIPPLLISLFLRAHTERFSTSILFYLLIVIQTTLTIFQGIQISRRTRLFADEEDGSQVGPA